MNFFREQILTLPQLIDDVRAPFDAEAARIFDAGFCKSLGRCTRLAVAIVTSLHWQPNLPLR